MPFGRQALNSVEDQLDAFVTLQATSRQEDAIRSRQGLRAAERFDVEAVGDHAGLRCRRREVAGEEFASALDTQITALDRSKMIRPARRYAP